jgi:thiol-disulfide isomerase/thioredoxin
VKRALIVGAAVLAVLGMLAAGLYAWNTAPKVASIPAAEQDREGRPYVIKLHAQWCPKCLMTKGAWSELQAKYTGRVHFLVFDFTNQATTDASGLAAHRVGLGDFFENTGGTGSVIVLDGRTREVHAWLSGVHDVAEYSEAIDAALRKSGV